MMRPTTTPPIGCEHYASQAEMPPELVSRLRQCALEYGDTYASYLATEDDRQYFWGAGGRGVVSFERRGRYVTVADGLLADPDDREQLLSDFLAFAAQNRWHTSYLNVPRNEINLFRRLGCQVTKCGEEPLVRLQRTTWSGKEGQWVRRQESYCVRNGVTMHEVTPDVAEERYRNQIAPQLDEISRDHVAHTLHRKELQFFVSQFSSSNLRDRRLFVAEHQGRVIAFIVCNPALAGDMWAVEVYRRRRDAVRGVIPGLIMHAMRRFQAEGVSFVSLSLAPFVRCTPVAGDSAMFRWIANFWWRFLNPIYDMRGLFHFKSRFHPDYREMFLAAHPRITVRSLWSMAAAWRLFEFNPLDLLRRTLVLNRSADRSSLVQPQRRSERLLRDLRGTSLRPADLGSRPAGLAPRPAALGQRPAVLATQLLVAAEPRPAG